MAAFKSRLPRANPPICGECDRLLYGHGAFYVSVTHHARGVLKVHRQCADALRRGGEVVEDDAT